MSSITVINNEYKYQNEKYINAKPRVNVLEWPLEEHNSNRLQ